MHRARRGIDAAGRVIVGKSDKFLVHIPALQACFRHQFRQRLKALDWEADPAVWRTDWGINIQPFGTEKAAIKYLGAYVCRTAIGDSRIVESDAGSVTFRWKNRDKGDRTSKRQPSPAPNSSAATCAMSCPAKCTPSATTGFSIRRPKPNASGSRSKPACPFCSAHRRPAKPMSQRDLQAVPAAASPWRSSASSRPIGPLCRGLNTLHPTRPRQDVRRLFFPNETAFCHSGD